jgi:hypothetical protein
MGLSRRMKLNNSGENLSWTRQTRVRTLYPQQFDVGLRTWQRMLFDNGHDGCYS